MLCLAPNVNTLISKTGERLDFRFPWLRTIFFDRPQHKKTMPLSQAWGLLITCGIINFSKLPFLKSENSTKYQHFPSLFKLFLISFNYSVSCDRPIELISFYFNISVSNYQQWKKGRRSINKSNFTDNWELNILRESQTFLS